MHHHCVGSKTDFPFPTPLITWMYFYWTVPRSKDWGLSFSWGHNTQSTTHNNSSITVRWTWFRFRIIIVIKVHSFILVPVAVALISSSASVATNFLIFPPSLIIIAWAVTVQRSRVSGDFAIISNQHCQYDGIILNHCIVLVVVVCGRSRHGRGLLFFFYPVFSVGSGGGGSKAKAVAMGLWSATNSNNNSNNKSAHRVVGNHQRRSMYYGERRQVWKRRRG